MGFASRKRDFHIVGSDTQAYKQFGNAVVVPVVEFLARSMRLHIETALKKEKRATITPLSVTRPPVLPAVVNG
jgi:DNA (cytosine-5)-methyltransferase 1